MVQYVEEMSSNRCKGTENLLIMQDFELFFMFPARLGGEIGSFLFDFAIKVC